MSADRIDDSRTLAYLVGSAMVVYVADYLTRVGSVGDALDINLFNFIFTALGLFLHGTPRASMEVIRDATEGAAGIILQFPFYAGILGILSGRVSPTSSRRRCWTSPRPRPSRSSRGFWAAS